MARRALTAEETARVEWVCSYCAQNPDPLGDELLDKMISIEAQFKEDGKLSDLQLDELERMYKLVDESGI